MAAGSPATRPSVIGVGDVRRVFYLAASLPAAEAGIGLLFLERVVFCIAGPLTRPAIKPLLFRFYLLSTRQTLKST